MSARIASRRKDAADRKARRKAKAHRIGTKVHAKQSLNAAIRALAPELHRAIRERDGAVCFSCGAAPLGPRNWQAGHLFAVGAFPSVRFHPLNIHSQCSQCNMKGYGGKAGNHAAYSAKFIERYGLAEFETLYRLARAPMQWRADELISLLAALKEGGLPLYGELYFEELERASERRAA